MFGGGRAGMWGRLQYTNTRGFAMNQRFACVPYRFSNAAWPGGQVELGCWAATPDDDPLCELGPYDSQEATAGGNGP